MGPEPIRTVWYDNHAVNLFLPDALDDRIQSIILEEGKFFDVGNLRAVQPLISPHFSVVDVGANIGNHTIFFASVCGVDRVFAFEPQARLVEVIERNKTLNGLDDGRVKVFAHGCGARNGRLKIQHQNIYNLGATRFEYAATGDFEVRRLDDCGLGRVDFMKIDSERMGFDVLHGAAHLINTFSPIIWIELYGDEIRSSIEFLQQRGYSFRNLTKIDFLFTKNL